MRLRLAAAFCGLMGLLPGAAWATNNGCQVSTTFNTNGSGTTAMPLNTANSLNAPCPVLQSWTGGALDTAPGTSNTTAALPMQGVTGGVPLATTSNIAQVGSASISLGQKTSANSFPVVLPSDQGALAVTGTFWQATQPVSAASLPLPAGAAISANQSAIVDQATIVQGTSKFNPIGAFYASNANTLNLVSQQAGMLRVNPERFLLTSNGLYTSTLTAWTSATTVNSTQALTDLVSGINAVLVQLDQTTTITGGSISFQGTYDGTNWVTLAAYQVVDPTSSTGAQISLPYTLQASTNKPFLLLTNGFQQVRILLSTAITGTGSVTPYVAALPYQPITAVSINCGGIACNATDNGTFTPSSTTFSPIGGLYQTTATSNPVAASGDMAAAQITHYRALMTDPFDSTGTELTNTTLHSVNVSPVLGTTGGWTLGQTASLSTTVTAIKASAGQLGYMNCYNPNSAVAYIQVFNVAAGSVTLGTTAPTEFLPIPPALFNGFQASVGHQYGTAISYASTTTPTGSTANSSPVSCSYGYN